MRKRLLLLFVLFTSLSMSAQKVHFTDPANQWKSASIVMDTHRGIPFVWAKWQNTYGYITDTFYDHISYKRLSPTLLIREDTVAKKVFYRYISDSEHVLLDYNLQVGDTVRLGTPSHSGYYFGTVTSIDSTIINGVWHRVWRMTEYYQFQPYIIEGVGNSYGPKYFITAHYPIYDREYLYCFSNNSIAGYSTSGMPNLQIDNNCSPLGIDELKTPGTDIVLYPVPATTTLIVESGEKITQLTICNLVGQTILNRTGDDNKVEIEVANFAAGVYFITINRTIVRKFLKQ